MQAARRAATRVTCARPCSRLLAPSAASLQQCRRRQARRAAAATTTTAASAASAPSAADADPFFLASVDEMQQAMRQFDRDMDSMFWGGGHSPFLEAEWQTDRALRRADEELADARRQAATATATTAGENERQQQQQEQQRNGNNVRVERSESRAPGSYRYYERIEISSGPGYWGQQPLATAGGVAAAPPPLLLLVALVAAGAYAAVTAAFARNYDLTLYAARDKLRLALTWPLLLPTSRSFRAQFVQAVVRGERVRVTNGSAAAAAAPLPSSSGGEQQAQVGGGGDGCISTQDGEARAERG